jgi:signal transduction histidine kinase
VNAFFMCGLVGAWTIALVAMGMFFCLAFALGRREPEYLLFGLLTLTFAVASCGIALSYGASTLPMWRAAEIVANTGAIMCVPAHLHFVLRYVHAPRIRGIAAGYALGPLAALTQLAGLWWIPGTETWFVTRAFGHDVWQITRRATLLTAGFYGVALLSLLFAGAVLVQARRRGQREALFALVGTLGLILAGANDALLVTRSGAVTLSLLPHAFLLYSFWLAGNLVYRYRGAAGALETTASDLRERTAELWRSYDELSVMEREFVKQEQLAAVGELAASIAHEVRNPLAVIVNATASLRRPKLREPDRETLLGIVDEEATRLNQLVTGLLRFARPVDPRPTTVDLRSLILRASAQAAPRHQVAIDIADSPAITELRADPELLQRALENLVENAAQSLPDDATIRVSAHAEPPEAPVWVSLAVADDGPGMPPDVKKRALSPFFTTRSRGTGLGLPMVKRIVEAHEGEMIIDSEPNHGTTVHLLLPLATMTTTPRRRRQVPPEPQP